MKRCVPSCEGTWLEKRSRIGAQAAQPAISDSRSVLHQRRYQPVSRTVLSPNVGKKRGEIEISIFAHFSSLPVTICPTGRSAKEPIMDLWDPLSFPHGAGKKPSGRSLFCQEASANQPIQVKTRPPLPVVLGWTQWWLLLLSIQC